MWKDGKKNGQGTYETHESGQIYVGKFLNDKMNGHGTMTYANGDVYWWMGRWREKKNDMKSVSFFSHLFIENLKIGDKLL